MQAKKLCILPLVFIVGIMLAVGGCGRKQTAEAPTQKKPEEKIVIKLAYVIGTTEPAHIAAEKLKQRVEERTNGRVEIQLYPNAQLGSDKDVYEQARMGVNVMAYASYLDDYCPDWNVIHGPYLTTSHEEKLRLTSSDFFNNELKNKVLEKGLRIVTWNWLFGYRHIIADRPVPTPKDLKGLKIRVPPADMWKETFAALGASPVALAWAEVYTALAQKVVNGAEGPLSSHYTSKLYEVAKYITLTWHFLQVNGWIIGEKFWQTLPQDVQNILLEEFRSIGNYNTELVLQKDKEFMELLKKQGVTFVEADVKAYQEATKVVYERLGSKWSPGLYERALQALK